jgi:hypothetical protein
MEAPALHAAARWQGTRRAELLAHEADFLRLCVTDSLVPVEVGAESWLLERAMTLARASLAIDPGNLQALQTLATLTSDVPRFRDPMEELRVRRRLVELRPGDLNELTPYFRVVLRLTTDTAGGDPGLMDEAERVRQRFVRLLEMCSRVHPYPALARLRVQWSRPLETIPELH